MNRRQFIKDISCLLGSAYILGCASKTKLADKQHRKLAFFTIENSLLRHGYGHLIGGENSLVLLDVDTLELTRYPLPMTAPHSLIQHPQMKNLAIITPRDRPLALAFDLREGRVLGSLVLDNNQNFYGHGFFSQNGERLFLSGYGGNAEESGFLKEYDLKWRPVGYLETFGGAPHDIKAIREGTTALVANNGWSGRSMYHQKKVTSMAYVDLRTRKLVEKIERAPGYIAFQHFECDDNGDFVVGCDYYGRNLEDSDCKSLLAYREVGKDIRFLDIDVAMRKELNGNILSLRWDRLNKKALTTTPQGPVTIWDLETMRATEQILSGYFPHGIESRDREFLVTTANKGIWSVTLGPNGAPGKHIQFKIPYIQNISAHSTWVD